MIKMTSILYEVLAKLLNAISPPIALLWIDDFSISEFASNIPTTRNVTVNFYGIGSIEVIRRLHPTGEAPLTKPHSAVGGACSFIGGRSASRL